MGTASRRFRQSPASTAFSPFGSFWEDLKMEARKIALSFDKHPNVFRLRDQELLRAFTGNFQRVTSLLVGGSPGPAP